MHITSVGRCGRSTLLAASTILGLVSDLLLSFFSLRPVFRDEGRRNNSTSQQSLTESSATRVVHIVAQTYLVFECLRLILAD